MKTKLFSLILGIALLSNVALADWITFSSGTSNSIANIKFINDQTGYMVGASATVLRTTNSGSSWELLTVPTVSNLSGISFPTPLIGYISGGNTTTARMIKTTDGGNTWSVLNFPVSAKLHDVDFINETTGYAVGSNKIIIKTTDGGANWVIQNQGGSEFFRSVKAFSESEVICCGSMGLIYKTTNGGTNWVSKTSPTTNELTAMDFPNGMEGYILGVAGFILKTANRGEDWTMISIAGWTSLRGIKFLTVSTGFAVGVNGAIIKTTDGGSSWVAEQSGTTEYLVCIEATPSHLHVGGDNGIYIRSGNPIGIQNISSEIPSGYKLSQNYPNPFNPVTNIEFSIPSKGNVKLTVFDITGKEVGLLVNDVLSPGTYKFDFNANHLSSGTYFYRLVAGDYVETKKMVLVK